MLVPIGAVIGSIIGGFISRYGRRVAFIVIDIYSFCVIGVTLYAIN